ncbi:uncharacterized protein LOC34623473 [Cyclospora cayetanensis]|uniref:Uncharacterized protein LOC34623473 n=1 Tax=Cyclospora cayetanensis TaxID=88456 RepID=A0A6P6RSA6_9EIME|nr:uncharacterized protein LOC34623473 [Cyclospora cayetanensis]
MGKVAEPAGAPTEEAAEFLGFPEPAPVEDVRRGASSTIPLFAGEAFWGHHPSEQASLSQGPLEPYSATTLYGPPTVCAPPLEGPPGTAFEASFEASDPAFGAFPRAPTPAEVSKGIFLCERVVLEYSGNSQLPAEVRLALKHPHGYQVKGGGKGPLGGPQGAPHEDAYGESRGRGPARQIAGSSAASRSRREQLSTPRLGEQGVHEGRGGASGGVCDCSDCERCRAFQEARRLLSPFGVHLLLGNGGPDGARGAGGPPGGRAAGKAEEQSDVEAALPLALACMPSNAKERPPGEGPPGAPEVGSDCVCALLESGRAGPSPEGPPGAGEIGGFLVCESRSLKQRAAVEAAAAIKRALTYFLLEAPPPATATAVRMLIPRALGQKDPTSSAASHTKSGPLAAVKLLPQQQNLPQPQHQQEGTFPRTTASPSRSSRGAGGSIERGSDGPRALLLGLLDAVVQLHDVSCDERQAAVSANHFSGILANNRVVLTRVSSDFRAFLMKHEEEVLKAEFPKGFFAARRQQQEARRKRALSAGGPPLEAPGGAASSGTGEEGRALNELLRMGPTFSLHCFVFEGRRQARALLKLLKAFVTPHAELQGATPSARAPVAPSTFNSFVAAAAAHTSAEAKAFELTGRRALGASLQVYMVVSNFRVRGARVMDCRVSFSDTAIALEGGLSKSTKRLRIRGLMLPQSQRELLNATKALAESGSLSDCSLFWDYCRQPHRGAPFYEQGLALCFPGEKLWRHFQSFGGALAARREDTFSTLRALVPEALWGLAAKATREAQLKEQQRAAARAAAATAAAGTCELELSRPAASVWGVLPAVLAAPAAAACLRQSLLCLTYEGSKGPVESLGDPAFFYCCQPDVVEQMPPPHSLLLQQAPVECMVAPVFFRFVAKHGAPPPFDADLAPPLRPAWLRSLAALKTRKREGAFPIKGAPSAAAAGVAVSLGSVIRIALEEAALTRRPSACLSASGAVAAAAASPAAAIEVYAVVLEDPEESAAAASHMKALLEMQRRPRQGTLTVHFVTAAWAYKCLHEGVVNPASALPFHLQVEGLPPCCWAGEPPAPVDSLVPLEAPVLPEKRRDAGAGNKSDGGPCARFMHASTCVMQEPWGLPLFGWFLLATHEALAALAVPRDELETVWGVSIHVLPSLSPHAVLKGLLALLASFGLDPARAPLEMQQMAVFAVVLAPDSLTPENLADEALGSSPALLPRLSPGAPLTSRKPPTPGEGPGGPPATQNLSVKPALLSSRLHHSPSESPLRESRRSAAGDSSTASPFRRMQPRPSHPLRAPEGKSLESAASTRFPFGDKEAPRTPLRTAALRGPQLSSGPFSPRKNSCSPLKASSSPLRAASSPSRGGPSSPLRSSTRGGPSSACRANLALHHRCPWSQSWGPRSNPPRFCMKSGTYRVSIGKLRVLVPGLEAIPLVKTSWVLECLRTRRLLPLQQFFVVPPQEQHQQLQQQHQQQQQQQQQDQQAEGSHPHKQRRQNRSKRREARRAQRLQNGQRTERNFVTVRPGCLWMAQWDCGWRSGGAGPLFALRALINSAPFRANLMRVCPKAVLSKNAFCCRLARSCKNKGGVGGMGHSTVKGPLEVE